MVVRMKKDDIERAVNEYIKNLFGDVQVLKVSYKAPRKESGVAVEVEIEKQNGGEK